MKASGARILAEMLAGYGVSHVFMVPAVLRRTFAEMEHRTSIHRIHTHGEKAAAYMADGYARASGKPGVCMAQVVGALNLAAGLRDASRVATSGAPGPVHLQLRGNEAQLDQQEAEMEPLVEPQFARAPPFRP